MSDDTPIRVLLADDHAVVREGLRSLVHLMPDMIVVGEASDGLEPVALAKELSPDVILMDMVMPRQNGLARLRLRPTRCTDGRTSGLKT